jgi:tRNA-dihydrouridine synthase A
MLKNNYTFSVAPMMGVTTPSARFMYRLISKKAVLFTEMVASQAIYRGDYNKFLKKNSIEEPVVLQVGGSDNELLKFSTNLANKYGYQGVNLNVGCPSKKVSQGRMGACLMKEADIVRSCVKAMISESSSEVSVKCRIGVDEFESYNFFKEFISNVSDSGCNTFFVHARKAFLKGLDPKKNRTLPPLKYDYVYKLKREMPQLNIIINGGIQTLEECHNQLKSVDGVMIGRSIQANHFFL